MADFTPNFVSPRQDIPSPQNTVVLVPFIQTLKTYRRLTNIYRGTNIKAFTYSTIVFRGTNHEAYKKHNQLDIKIITSAIC